MLLLFSDTHKNQDWYAATIVNISEKYTFCIPKKRFIIDISYFGKFLLSHNTLCHVRVTKNQYLPSVAIMLIRDFLETHI